MTRETAEFQHRMRTHNPKTCGCHRCYGDRRVAMLNLWGAIIVGGCAGLACLIVIIGLVARG